MARAEITGRKPRARSSRRGLTRTGAIRTAPTAVYSVASFCVAHGISEAFYFKLKNQGLGPDEMRLGARIFITHEAAARWRTVREAATTAATEKASATA
jgi:hypothetical protein